MIRLSIILLSVLLSQLLMAQNPFDRKMKLKEQPYDLEGFELIKPTRKARRVVTPAIFNDFKNETLFKTIRNPSDPSYLFVENIRLPKLSKKGKVSVEGRVYHFLENIKDVLATSNIQDDLEVVDIREDKFDGTHVQLQQKIHNIPVYGGELIVHLKKSEVKTMNGHLFANDQHLEKSTFLTAEEATTMAFADLKNITAVQEAGLKGKLISLQQNKSQLYYYQWKEELVPAYELTLRPNILERWVYFVHAETGEILNKYNHTCTIDGVFSTTAADLNGINRTFIITQEGNNFFMVDPSKKMFDAQQSKLPNSPKGAVWTIDAQNSRINDREMEFSHVVSRDGQSWSPTAVSAHTNASQSYDYFENTFGRNSLNGSGGNIISVINITDEDGNGMDNAYWNGEFMGYGNGNKAFLPLAGALDVAGHEMTHGVIENTARLEYRNQSGAMNESFADIFGTMIDRDDWTLGEEVVRASAFPSGALRSLENPNQGGKNRNGYQPKNMSQYEFLRDIPSENNGGVHINSGIPNHAFYLFATGNGMNKEKAEQVYYHTLNNYLTRTSQFLDLRLAVEQSTKDLYGSGVELQAAQSAFDEVGIVVTNNENGGGNTNPTPTQEEQEIPINPGEQFIVVYEPEGRDIYNGLAGSQDFRVIVDAKGCKKKPSITDDGTTMYFVGLDSHIYSINLQNPQERAPLSSNAVWANVAISKDGKLLAALTDAQEPFIYVFDLVGGQNVKFELFNPTYTQGVSTGEVLFADSFEWDYSGEFLIYDAFNRAKGIFGDFEYWDVGVLKAWDIASNSFAEGDIQKIFTDLDEGDNIGNPAIAKTNPNVIAFDYLNSETNKIFLLGVNLLTNDLEVILENNAIGFPDYTIDDRVLAYNTFNQLNEEVVQVIGLNEDRITSASNTGQRLFSGGQDKWAVFYAQGQRALPQKQVQQLTFNAIGDRTPGTSLLVTAATNTGLPVQFSVLGGDASVEGNVLTCGQSPGRVQVRAFQIGNSDFTPISKEQEFCIIPSTPNVVLNGEMVSVQSSGIFQWYINGRPVGGQTTNRTFDTRDFAGAYTVKQITEDGCESTFSNSIVTQDAILSLEKEDIVRFYPNPARDYVELISPSNLSLKSIQLLDVKGKVLRETTESKVSLMGLSAGNYLLKAFFDGKEVVKSIVKL